MGSTKGRFTLPGEAGYEKLTLKMAEKWGADVIRDSDGTELSDDILQAGYGIYSTICIIRDHNEWAEENPGQLQQTFLMAGPVLAEKDSLEIGLMEKYYAEQFSINETEESLIYWQVYDRTTDSEVPRKNWSYMPESKAVLIHDTVPFHTYTVSFLAYQIWEQISMYNHVTNHWNKEHLVPLDPRHPKARTHLLNWLELWCVEHPSTTVVRFTSLFYNFTWIWGASEQNRNLFADWGSYDFTVSPLALQEFEHQYGYAMTAEDFINKGNFQVTHMPASAHKRDWMEFISHFVADLGKEMVDIVHRHGKKAYVFYDDSWIGLEPYGKYFPEIGFDGMIKCVFSGYEARLCAGVPTQTHEIRLHPYLFPVGLGGAPTFMEGGNPTSDAQKYWVSVRRALLRVPIERIGLGGYLHLTENYPEFQDYIEKTADDFRMIEAFHQSGKPYATGIRAAVLHDWGGLRPWTLSGHFHETWMHDLVHVNEALSGLPLDVDFINFEDVKNGCLKRFDVVINAGKAGDAWSGGNTWKDEKLLSELHQWVYEGGVLIGIDEPSAISGYDCFYRTAMILGVDQDTGAKVCHGKWTFETAERKDLLPDGCFIPKKENRYLTDGTAQVLLSHADNPDLTMHRFGAGCGIYMGGFIFSAENTRMLMNLILAGVGRNPEEEKYMTDNLYTECAYFAEKKELIVINNTGSMQQTAIKTDSGTVTVSLAPYAQEVMPV